MLRLNFEKLRTILCLGAHSDDLEIGAGGTLMTLLAQRPELSVHWVVFQRRRRARCRGSGQRRTVARNGGEKTC